MTTVNERSALTLTFTFTDEAGAAVVPTAANWTLTDEAGVVVNGRAAVPIAPAASVNVTLSGADTALRTPADSGQRRVTVSATYNSTYGNGLTLVREAAFTITGVAAVAPLAGAEGQLARLAREVAALAPPVGASPTTAQYRAAVAAAVADFGYRCPRVLYATIPIVAGTAAYALPAGFQRLIELEGLSGETTRDASGFLVAFDMGASPVERHVISGNTITFYPTPGYTLARPVWYAAGYPYDAATDAFAGLTAEGERVAMLRAQANALRALVGATAAGRGFNYSIGDVSVQRLVTQPHAQLAGEMDSAYEDACRSLAGFIGARAEYSGWEAYL